MKKIDRETFPFYRFDRLAACREINHFVSSGVKDISFLGNEEPGRVVANRRELGENAGFELDRLVVGNQVHGADITVVTAEDAGRGAYDNESRLPDTDALVTDEAGVCLMVLTADCVPVLLYDPKCGAIAAIHAGWKGTAADIVGKTVNLLRKRYGSEPRNILAGIGPAIGKCCFEVGEEVASVFQGRYPEQVEAGKNPGKFQVDLGAINYLELLQAGLDAENIEQADICTRCHPHDFFSYRYAGGAAGRFGTGILLREKCESKK